MKKRTIAIVAGGDSSELPVSLRSAQGIYSFIDKERYNLYIVEMQGKRWEVVLPNGEKTPIDRNDFSFTENGEKKIFDFAYITIHGTPGENGILQGYFDLLEIPYSSCNVLVSAMTFNKFTCNQYLKGFGIRVSESMVLRKGFEILDEEVINKGFKELVEEVYAGNLSLDEYVLFLYHCCYSRIYDVDLPTTDWGKVEDGIREQIKKLVESDEKDSHSLNCNACSFDFRSFLL